MPDNALPSGLDGEPPDEALPLVPPPVPAAPPQVAPALQPTIPGQLPPPSNDVQAELSTGAAGETAAGQNLASVQQQGAADVSQAQDDKSELRDKQTAEYAAELQFNRDRDAKLDAEDAANLEHAKSTVIPAFWAGKEGKAAGAAITVGLSGFLSGALAGMQGTPVPPNAVVGAISNQADKYFEQKKTEIDNLYKYAEQKGVLNDKIRKQYANQLSDLLQQHSMALESAADRVDSVKEASAGRIDAAKTDQVTAALRSRAAEQKLAARDYDVKLYSAGSAREVADARAAKLRGAGGGTSNAANVATLSDQLAAHPEWSQGDQIRAAAKLGIKDKDKAGRASLETIVADLNKSGKLGEGKAKAADAAADKEQATRVHDIDGNVVGHLPQLGNRINPEIAHADTRVGNARALINAFKELRDDVAQNGNHLIPFTEAARNRSSLIANIQAAKRVAEALPASEGGLHLEEAQMPGGGQLFGVGTNVDLIDKSIARIKEKVNTQNRAMVHDTPTAVPAPGSAAHSEGDTAIAKDGKTPIIFRGGKWVKNG